MPTPFMLSRVRTDASQSFERKVGFGPIIPANRDFAADELQIHRLHAHEVAR